MNEMWSYSLVYVSDISKEFIIITKENLPLLCGKISRPNSKTKTVETKKPRDDKKTLVKDIYLSVPPRCCVMIQGTRHTVQYIRLTVDFRSCAMTTFGNNF